MRHGTALVAGFLTVMAWASCAAAADGKRPLSDAEMALITAGSTGGATAEEVAAFEFAKRTGSGTAISGEGAVKIVNAANQLNFSALSLSDSAQSNLQSLVNINAVNAPVNVLLNLNINIDSHIGSMRQLNLSGAVPGASFGLGN